MARSRTLLLFLCFVCLPCILVNAHVIRRADVAARALGVLPGPDPTTATTDTTATLPTATTPPTAPTSPPPPPSNPSNSTTTAPTPPTSDTTSPTTTGPTSPTTPVQPPPTSPSSNTTSPTTSSTTTSSPTTNATPPPSSSPTPTGDTQAPSSSTTYSVNAEGQTSTIVVMVTPTDTSPAPTNTSPSPNQDNSAATPSSGISTSTIIGLSVAGGIAVIGVIAFFVWKFTRKRLSDLDDEAIKWPDLNQHNGEGPTYALPTKATGRAGFGPEGDSDTNLTREASVNYNGGAAESTASLYAPGGAGDSYAVPPLPHLNPNAAPQPYRDDPTGYNAFYDPYRGPVPQTFNDNESVDSHAAGGYGGETIPMSTLAPGGVTGAGRRSPVPPPGLGYGDASSLNRQMSGATGRQATGPPLGYDGRRSPAPPSYMTGPAGRQSPAPGLAYGGAR